MIEISEMKQCAYDFMSHDHWGRSIYLHEADLGIDTPNTTIASLNAIDFLIASKQSEIQSLEYFLNMGQLVVMVSDLIHALQKERGASSRYLGSRGHYFSDELVNYSHETDQQVIQFNATLTRIYREMANHAGNSRLLNRIAYALHALAGLPLFRAQVHQFDIETDVVVLVFSEMISGLLSIVFETADAAVDPTIARILVALFNLMHGKELMGQERAVGAAGFSAERFTTEQCERLQRLMDGQERCFELFHEFSDPASRMLYDEYSHSAYMIEIEKLRRLALSHSSRRIESQQGSQWFKLLTEHIDNLKTVELGLQMHLQQLCLQRVSDAKQILTQQQDLVQMLPMHIEDTFVVFLSASQTPKSPLSTQQDYYHSDGIGPKLGRSVFELVQDQAHSLQQMHDKLTAARTAIEEKKLQEKAKVLLMKTRKLSEDQAHKLLRQMAMDQGKRLAEIAKIIVEMEPLWR
ncbi:MAG: nitrate- and nitrite sensing domain-containing protein [Gammaproteobacteria bacterium]|nr:nitrate- and nitrite sensing domain-containing protein [Gammaproteobacteria bacterium]